MRRLVLALGAISLLACGDSTGVGASSAVGTWNLFSVNGSPVPFTLIDEPDFRVEILSEQLVFFENGTYTDTFTDRVTESGTATTTTESDTGTWSQNGSSLTTITSAGDVSTSTISGNSITLSASGFVVVYRRQ